MRRDPKNYFRARIRAMINNHHFRYPKWNEKDVEMIMKLLDSLDENYFSDKAEKFLDI